ncbi:uncharacterized protein mslnb isoform X3 [Ctenopharyngodon idella]|uniref:uncharacterized protein mslnb isoform X3 n=1 Tax=Ctenopharyngodon idella TaxID=7959 RepID=UPI00223222E5|nr:uncharacterized protein mslnb isoform X3 [Ctenopharyngodon idella]
MRTPLIFPLLCVGVMAFGSICSAVQTQTCGTSAGLTAEQCTDMDGPTQGFLTCAGVPSEPDADHILNLKGLISAALDVYSFMRSSVSGVPVLDLSGGVSLNEDHVIRAWLDIKLTPLLSSISRNFLTCLSNRNFSCSAYQTVVKELSQHFSGLDPVRQKWIYSFFMYPFLSRNTSSGCVDPEDSTEDWLMKNFGSFAVMAQVRDFTSINMLFGGLEVLHLLSPEQKAELLLHPEVVGLTNSSLDLVFQSLLSSLMPSEDPWTSNNSTQYYLSTLPSSLPQDPLGQALNGFMTAFRPVGSFVREFVSLTQQQNLSGMRSATLLQAMINLTLAEIAAPFKQNPTQEQQVVSFDPTNINDWFTHVVSPLLRRFLPHNQIEIHPNLTAVFHNQFYIETGMGPGAQNESQDICSVFIDNRTCGLTDLVEHVATVLHCAARSNLTLNEETLLNVLLHLSQNLNALLQQLSMTNFSSQSSPFSDMLDQIVDDTFTMSNLQDESFVRLWFQVKLKPLLSTLTPEYLMCLSHKEFSCQTFQILISELSDNMFLMSEGAENIYKYFIFSFLSRQNVSGGCPAENSIVWVTLNLGEFSQFSTLREMYQLNQDFNAINALVVLSPKQTAELIVEDFAGLPEKSVIINMVFDHILFSPEDRGLLEMLRYLIVLAGEMGLECSSYQQIVQKLQESAVPPHMMQPIKNNINQLEQMAPPGCFPPLVTCISTPFNETSICDGISSNKTLLSAGLVSAPCSIDLQQYACSSLTGFTAVNLAELLKCQLSSSSNYSKEIWKLLFSKTNNVLDEALVIFSSTAANMSQPIRGDVMSQVLDVIGELRLESISPDQWSNVTFISMLLGSYLKPFLPYASPSLLKCTSSKNLSCQTYQNILTDFPPMTKGQRINTVEFFILPFLRRNATDAGCVSSSNNSTDWLLKNFGSFAQFVTLKDLLSINRLFDPLETLVYLSPAQMVALMVEDLPGLPQKEVVINRVFNHLLVSPVDRELPKVLELLYVFSTTSPLSCQTNQIIFTRLDHILRSAAGDLEPIIWASVYNFSLTAPTGCSLLPGVDECPLTPYNETRVCSGVDSSALQLFLNNGDATKSLCDFSIAEYACTPVLNVSVEQLLSVLDCHLSGLSPVTSSPDSWKLLLTRVSNLLDGALITLSNRSAWWSSSSGSVVLDVLRELRLDRLTDDGSVALWLGERLRPFLPFASNTFLQCLRSKNFSCQNFQTVVEAFNAGFLHMNDLQRQITVTDFIVPFLSSQPKGAACVSDDSSQWLIRNFGQFSALVPLNQLISLNTQFSPLSSLLSLSPEQLVGLMFDDVPGLPEKSVIINAVFDHLIAYPQEVRIKSTLHFLVELSKTRNISCASYQIIFHRLDHLMVSVSVNLETVILRSKSALLQQVPPGCVSSSRQCGVTPVDETAVCRSVNSSGLLAYLASTHDGSQLCQFSITQYACAELSVLSAQDLVKVLLCSLNLNENVSSETWKLFTQKVNPVLGPALDQLANTRLNKSLPSVSFLNMIGEVTLSSFSSTNLRDVSFVQHWFGSRLRPFLPYASEAFLSCLSTRDFSCDTFRIVVQSFSQSFDIMSNDTQANVYVDFIKVFLSQNNTAGCVGVSQNSSDWLISSFGRFSVFTKVTELQTLNPSFSVLDILSLLSLKQLVEVSSTPGVLSSAAAVDHLLLNVPDAQFTTFYTSLSVSLQMQGVVLPPPVQDTFLQQVFDRANLTTLSDDNLKTWILNILPPFITNITVQHVTTYFSVVQQRPCPISQQAVQLLNSSSSTFQPATQDQIYQQILGSLAGPTPLRCYGNQSYYAFLTSSFMSFQFPNLTTFLTLMPPARVPELMESMSPVEVSSLLNRPNAVDDVTKICQLFTNYPKTPQYLQTQPLGSVALARQVLSCVWLQVLKVELQSEVNQWFDSRLVQYLPLLTSEFIGPDVMQYSSCLSFKKFVSVMSKYNFSAVEFSQSDVYNTILVYLNTTSSAPKCYNTSNPNLNSTAWFVDYISVFLSFITLDDLHLFGSIQPFTVNLENLQLFSQISVPDDVMEFYVTTLFEQNQSFSAYYLPVKFRCLAPASSFIQLSAEQLKNVSSSVQQNCTNIQPDVSAALASNAGVLTANTIEDLGQSCTGLSTAQISAAGGNVLLDALSVLRLVLGWNLDQAMMIIQTLLSSGDFQIDSADSLEKLGSLIIGVQTSVINVISGNVWLLAVKSQSFLASVTGTPIVVQQTIVSQIIAVNSSTDGIITNVPDLMATEIPRNFLLGVSSSSVVVQMVNQKKWKHEQAVLLFETVAVEFSDPDAISFQVLQGFTCSRIQSFSTSKVMSLIRGCRQRVNQTLVLQESQLTCMYYYIKSADLNAFSQYPAEVLIYYNYSMIDRSLCRSYFASLGKANFSVLSSTLSFKKQILLNSARECLGISGFSVTQEQLDVLGSMCCFLSTDYIQNSDPYVLEKLKQCPDLSAQQISAVESVLLRGNTVYGSSNSWNRTTLENLGMLPLYVTTNIWSKFTQENKQRFLKTFIRDLRRNNKASEMKILNMMNEVNKISRVKIKRAAETTCTAGEITQVQVYSDMFPFAYDVTQFNACLIVQTLKDNLEAITDRVYDRSYQRIILNKLYQAYPDGLSDEVLQVLGSTSRTATPDDVRKWNVKKIDTLSSLMNSRNGDWDTEMVQLLVSKYLSVSGNTLGTNELNALGGTNLCALTTSVLNNITAASVEQASALSLTNCSSEKKLILFSIALNAFSTKNTRNTNTVSIPTYQLLQNYLGGADSTFIRKLVNSAVNMDVPTFISLQQSVINVLNVTDVKSLLGVNIGDLKTYESAAQIQEWIRLQPQSDLDILQIGLTGGRNTTETTATTATSTTKAPSVAATTAAASRVWAPVCLQLLLLAVTMTTLQLLH